MFLSLLFRGRNLICDFDLREYVMQNFEGFPIFRRTLQFPSSELSLA
jgi:hypothetical protein